MNKGIISLQIKNFHKGNSLFLQYPSIQHFFKAKKCFYAEKKAFLQSCLEVMDIQLEIIEINPISINQTVLGAINECTNEDVFGNNFGFDEFYTPEVYDKYPLCYFVEFNDRGYAGYLFESNDVWLLRIRVALY
jgi:hypothetical protein